MRTRIDVLALTNDERISPLKYWTVGNRQGQAKVQQPTTAFLAKKGAARAAGEYTVCPVRS